MTHHRPKGHRGRSTSQPDGRSLYLIDVQEPHTKQPPDAARAKKPSAVARGNKTAPVSKPEQKGVKRRGVKVVNAKAVSGKPTGVGVSGGGPAGTTPKQKSAVNGSAVEEGKGTRQKQQSDVDGNPVKRKQRSRRGSHDADKSESSVSAPRVTALVLKGTDDAPVKFVEPQIETAARSIRIERSDSLTKEMLDKLRAANKPATGPASKSSKVDEPTARKPKHATEGTTKSSSRMDQLPLRLPPEGIESVQKNAHASGGAGSATDLIRFASPPATKLTNVAQPPEPKLKGALKTKPRKGRRVTIDETANKLQELSKQYSDEREVPVAVPSNDKVNKDNRTPPSSGTASPVQSSASQLTAIELMEDIVEAPSLRRGSVGSRKKAKEKWLAAHPDAPKPILKRDKKENSAPAKTAAKICVLEPKQDGLYNL